MGEINKLGSEKLKGDEKLNRILELTYFNKPIINKTKKYELVESTNNGVFVIAREKDGYYVKRGLNEDTVDYIGGMFMKNKFKFNSYAEAFKRLDLLKGQETINEATKYVLKQAKPVESTPPQEESDEEFDDSPIENAPPMDSNVDGQTPVDGEQKKSDYMSEIQKHSGKLGQELRDVKDQMGSDDIKYVINMILSAIDLEKLDPEDKKDISLRFDSNNEETDSEDVDFGDSEEPSQEPDDEDLGETMNKMQKFINEPAVQADEIDLSKYSDEEDIQEIDLEEIKKELNSNIHTTLSKYFK